MGLGLAIGAVAALIWAALHIQGTTRFVPEACSNVASFLPAHVVGQDLAISQLVDAVCEHLAPDSDGSSSSSSSGGSSSIRAQAPRKPLIISVHGPPGVGKTFTHTLLARALYNRDPAAAVDCPGEQCKGAKVLYGLNYLEGDRAGQLGQVRAAVLDHLRSTPNPLLVVEEYDKLDCDSRGLLRQLVRHPELANSSMSRAIVLLESNLGFLELEAMLTAAGGDKSQITPEAAESRLREVVLSAWRRPPACEGLEDTLAFGAAVDFFLPFFPLTRPEITSLMEMELRSRYGSRLEAAGGFLRATPDALAWLVDRVDFAGGSYPIEGAKQVSTVCVKHVSRLVRKAQEELKAARGRGAGAAHSKDVKGHVTGGQQHQHQHHIGSVVVAAEYVLAVAPSGRELQLLPVED
ncbi:hypothetical protein HYH02_006260 [Chlamydomonas schloesseri]|uniref:ORC1/DEAH AAA+ ATPase domain-containing protein n=1 Tax=Chlamydomonas schloesseri TaxID=2026947 RepID=A0A836B6C8_9CHLO|nr:hypothetical protein HYH02_006260 [Chlamydomonas schloesseri]|eukprot:KAG2448912.1 hypothetical protein HYH02_006260 [Chlamydomonas schloesseri]